MQKKLNIAIVGATGAVGEAILAILAERNFPVDNLYLLASARSAGKLVDFRKKTYTVEDLAQFDFSKVDIALFSAGGDVSAEYAPKAGQAGCIVIDNTSYFRYHDEVPLVVPEVNSDTIAHYKNLNIIANPNCSTIQMVVALKPIYDAVGIERINIATYQAVSGAGKRAIKELIDQYLKLLAGNSVESNVFPEKIAFNVLPQIDVFQENAYTKEEMKMVWETQKIFANPKIKVNPTAVRVPVVYGHSEAIHLETTTKISAAQARYELSKAEGVEVIDDINKGDYPTVMRMGEGSNKVFVGRIREDISHSNGLDLWVVADNVRKGAALNAVQIAEILLEKYL